MRIKTAVFDLLGRAAPDFACVKVRASADLVLAALAPFGAGVPRDLLGVIKGAPCLGDGRNAGRRAALYKLERDAWTTILREGDRYASFDGLLAQRLSRAIGTRALALYLDGNDEDVAYDIFENGAPVASFLHVQGCPAESVGVPSSLLEMPPREHARAVLAREDATNDRVSFRHFELSGMLRGRWDLSFERAVLVPELPTVEENSEERRVRKKKPVTPATPPSTEPRGVDAVLRSIIADTTRGL